MIKATIRKSGRPMLILGLSYANLRRLREEPLETFIRIDGAELGLPIDVVLFSGPTEAAMMAGLEQHGIIGPETEITIDDKLKN